MRSVAYTAAELEMGQVHPRVGLGWVGLRFFPYFILGRVGSNCVGLCGSPWM